MLGLKVCQFFSLVLALLAVKLILRIYVTFFFCYFAYAHFCRWHYCYGSNTLEITQVIQLEREFPLNDLGALHIFSGDWNSPHKDRLFLTHSRYDSDLLSLASLKDCKPVSMPLSTPHNIRKSEHNLLTPSAITSYWSVLLVPYNIKLKLNLS